MTIYLIHVYGCPDYFILDEKEKAEFVNEYKLSENDFQVLGTFSTREPAIEARDSIFLVSKTNITGQKEAVWCSETGNEFSDLLDLDHDMGNKMEQDEYLEEMEENAKLLEELYEEYQKSLEVSLPYFRCGGCGFVMHVGYNPKEDDYFCYPCHLRRTIIAPLKKEISAIEERIAKTRNRILKKLVKIKNAKKLKKLKEELEKRIEEVNNIVEQQNAIEERREKNKVFAG